MRTRIGAGVDSTGGALAVLARRGQFAASLVLQAGAMAKGGEVFVLDMGEPVRIVDFAEKMIHLMGCSIRDDKLPGRGSRPPCLSAFLT